jgi:hypothetical protein
MGVGAEIKDTMTLHKIRYLLIFHRLEGLLWLNCAISFSVYITEP